MKILVIDIGGTNIKAMVDSHENRRKLPSGPHMTPEEMVKGVQEMTKDWEYEVVSIGYPGVIKNGKIVYEPKNLGPGWRDFDFEKAFGMPVKIMNDAAMQALGSYKGGILFFLGLGTGMGSALVVHDALLPMELAHLSYRKGTFEDYVGLRGLNRLGQEKWQKHVHAVIRRFSAAFLPDDIVLGGGKSKLLTELPDGCRLGSNTYAYHGGLRLWDKQYH